VAAGLEPEVSKAPAKPYTVTDAIADYLADFEARGGKAVSRTRQAASAHILPTLGALPVGRLTREKMKGWHRALASAPARLRAKAGTTKTREADPSDKDAPRRRRATANRVLTILKAALNHARAEGKVTCPDDAWTAAKPFRSADAPKVRYLLDDEITRLINACPAGFRELVTAALLTGCRYGELTTMTVGAFDPQVGTLTVAESKGGKPRHVVLTDEGRTFFARQTAGRLSRAPIFERGLQVKQATKDEPAEVRRGTWGKSQQFRLLREACIAARIAPAISFHILRHTYASRLAMNGAPLPVIAAQLGHADTRMTEKHYAHMAPSYVADTVRASFGHLGIGGPAASASNVTAFPSARKGSA
jgi:integrase